MAVDFLPRASGRRGRGPLLLLIAAFFIGICFYTIPPSITYRATHDYTVSIYQLKQDPDQSGNIYEQYTQSIDQNHLDVIEEEMKEVEAQKLEAERLRHLDMEARHRVRDEKQRKFKKLRDASARARYAAAASLPDKTPPPLTLSIVYGRLTANETLWTGRVNNNIDRIAEYIVDDANVPGLHLEENKGREAAVYTKYIIEHYDNLTDITAFVHAANIAWHNNVLLHQDLVPTLNRLNLDHVFDTGYFNTRCDIYPGCPAWIPFNANATMQEKYADRALDTYSTNMWRELFGDDPYPDTLSEPCCSQFAVSREAIQAVPKEVYERIYRWLRREEFDMYAGRQMEYLWQYLFKGEESLCPGMRECYCSGYDICFDDDTELQEYIKARQDDDDSWVGTDGVRWGMKADARDAMKRLEATLPYTIGMDSKFSKKLPNDVSAAPQDEASGTAPNDATSPVSANETASTATSDEPTSAATSDESSASTASPDEPTSTATSEETVAAPAADEAGLATDPPPIEAADVSTEP